MFKELFNDNERGVSPVIGVILMVAITVILAAVIGAFVLGLGDNISNTAPQASITVSDTSASDNQTTLEHGGGDTIEFSETEIIVRNESGDGELNWDGSFEEPFETADEAVITTNGSAPANISLNGNVQDADDDSVEFDMKNGDRITITLIDKNSGEIIAERDIRV